MSEGESWIYSETVKEHFLNPKNFLMGDEKAFKCDAADWWEIRFVATR